MARASRLSAKSGHPAQKPSTGCSASTPGSSVGHSPVSSAAAPPPFAYRVSGRSCSQAARRACAGRLTSRDKRRLRPWRNTSPTCCPRNSAPPQRVSAVPLFHCCQRVRGRVARLTAFLCRRIQLEKLRRFRQGLSDQTSSRGCSSSPRPPYPLTAGFHLPTAPSIRLAPFFTGL